MGFNETMKALSDPTRRKILVMLKDRPLNAGQITAHFKVTNATISHHLSVLKKAGLLDCSRSGTFLTYELNTSLFEDVVNWMMDLKGDNES
jgi:DNA-binding transcriptional ArsR family regulator